MHTTATLADETTAWGIFQSAARTLSLWQRPARETKSTPAFPRRVTGAAPIAPPSGLITLLFTDIEGSTDLVRRLGDEYAPLLLAHERLLRRAARAWCGYEVDSQGDAFLFAFQDVADAVSAALRMQWDIASTLPEVRVRIGVHSGEPSLVDGRYIGLDVHRAARVAAAAHGGQIILSDTAYDLVASQMPEAATARDLGEHRLKDLHRPRRLYQLLAPGLPDAFPPLRTLNAHRHNLPTPTTPLVGRQVETRRLKAWLAETATRLVTLTGPGGVGKTRLALQAAAESVADYPDGVFFVPLGDVREAHRVGAAIALALDLTVAGGQAALDVVTAHLCQRRALLVLDNFEQVTAAGPDVATLLAAAPGVKVVVTSRVILRVYGETEFNVPPLSAPAEGDSLTRESLARYPAVELFVQRAQAVRPDFELTSDNALAVAAICDMLDGLPLAIELAAGRVRVMTVEQIADRLGDRLRLLRNTHAPELRHTSLQAALDWSYAQLTGSEAALFRRLSVFAGDFTLESVEQVCPDSDAPSADPILPTEDVLEALAGLIDKSLVEVQGEEAGALRHRLLYTVCAYAREKLKEAGEVHEFRRRHAEFFLDWLAALAAERTGDGDAAWLSHIETEYDNCRRHVLTFTSPDL